MIFKFISFICISAVTVSCSEETFYSPGGVGVKPTTEQPLKNDDEAKIEKFGDGYSLPKNEQTSGDAPLPDLRSGYSSNTIATNCSRPDLKIQNEKVTFAPRDASCVWNSGDNLAAANGKAQAYQVDQKSISLRDEQVVCDISIVQEETQFYADDYFFLLMNNNVIMSNTDFLTNKLTKVNEVYQFDWLKIRDITHPASDQHSTYCIENELGQSSCEVPSTQVAGKLGIDFSEKTKKIITENLVNDSKLNLSIVTTGDDNPNLDCAHSGVNLNLKITYYETKR